MLCVIICRPHPRRSSGPPLLRPPKATPRPARSSGSRRLRRPAMLRTPRHPARSSGQRRLQRPASAPLKGGPIWRVWKAAGKGGLMGSLPRRARVRVRLRRARARPILAAVAPLPAARRRVKGLRRRAERPRAQAALTGRSVPRRRGLGEERSRPVGFTCHLAAHTTKFCETTGKRPTVF